MKRKAIRSGFFDKDLEAIRDQGLIEKIERRIEMFPVSKVERVLNDSKAWMLRVDKKYVVFECTDLEGNPSDLYDTNAAITLLRVLDQDDLYVPSLDNGRDV